jgi:hypothetical protein
MKLLESGSWTIIAANVQSEAIFDCFNKQTSYEVNHYIPPCVQYIEKNIVLTCQGEISASISVSPLVPFLRVQSMRVSK